MTREPIPTYEEPELPQVDLTELSRRMRSRWALVVGLTAVAAVAALLYTLFAPAVWKAKSTLYFPVRPSAIVSAVGQSGDSALASLLPGSGATSLDIFRGFLESDSALDIVASSARMTPEDVLKMRRLETEIRNNTLVVTATSTDKEQALGVVTAHLAALRSVNARTQEAFSNADVAALDLQVRSLRRDMANLERQLVEFGRNNSGITITTGEPGTDSKPDETARGMAAASWPQRYKDLQVRKASIDARIAQVERRFSAMLGEDRNSPMALPAFGALRPRLVEAEAELRIRSQSLGPRAPEIRRLNETIRGLRAQMDSEVRKFVTAARKGIVEAGDNEQIKTYVALLSTRAGLEAEMRIVKPLADRSPSDLVQYGRLAGELQLKQSLLARAEAQAMMARLQGNRDPIKWNVLDAPRIERIPVNKHWARNLAVGMAIGLALGLLLAVRKPRA